MEDKSIQRVVNQSSVDNDWLVWLSQWLNSCEDHSVPVFHVSSSTLR